jgi:hypothetical protein
MHTWLRRPERDNERDHDMTEPQDAATVFPGADEKTASRAQYFSWINNTNEGATTEQTAVNLEFFKWLRDEYGMELDIYAFDAGAIDGAQFYGSTDSERFKHQFPSGFAPLYELARSFGCRLGVWGGPDGFGDTPQEEKARIEMMVSLCRDFEFALFKVDGVCGQLRPEKQDAFVEQMTECRKHSPDLILLNHRLELGKGLPHATTFLWGGAETYIDVHMANEFPATHNRACALQRGLPPDLQRLTEDHGVCLSSCLDFWEDDLVLQAFNRCLILAPEIYGNPWLLRDDEFPRLARIYNLHRRFRDIMVDGLVLPEDRFGPHAVSRGNNKTRLVTLRNLSWEPVTYRVPLDAQIGLDHAGGIELRRLHPHERIFGTFDAGSEVAVEVGPFRSCLLLATAESHAEIGVTGCEYDVVRDARGTSVIVDLLAPQGTSAQVALKQGNRFFGSAHLEGESTPALLEGNAVTVSFGGVPLKDAWHRKLGTPRPIDVPEDAQALYEATCFAADNNALEVRELLRSGPTAVDTVRRAREAFINQPVFRRRHLWDRHLFDNDPDTAFAVSRRWPPERSIRGGSFRLDLGAPCRLDRLVLEVGGDYFLQPLKSDEVVNGAASADLRDWTGVRFFAHDDLAAEFPPDRAVRYITLDRCPDRISQVRATLGGRELDRTAWRASNLFASYWSARTVKAWSLAFTLDEAAKGSYLAIPIHGRHGHELVTAALRVAGGYVGAPRRAPSYPSNSWECPVRQVDAHYTYYIPVADDMVGRPIEAVVLLLRGGNADVAPEVWLTAYPVPFASRRLVLDA